MAVDANWDSSKQWLTVPNYGIGGIELGVKTIANPYYQPPAAAAPGASGGYSIGPQSGNVPLPAQPAAPNVQLGQQPTDIMQSLQKVLQNPGDVASNPAYKFLQDQGAQMLSRQLGQTGQRFSGNALTAAEQYGQGLAGQYFGQLANTLGNAAQTQLSTFLQPAAAQAGLNLGAYNAGNTAWNNLAQTLLGNYNANIANASQINTNNRLSNQFATQANASAQGYGQLIPQINNIMQSLTGNGYGSAPSSYDQMVATGGGSVNPGNIVYGYPSANADWSAY